MSPSGPRAAVAGGGIAGLAAALACARAGCGDVRLFERSQAFSEVGAGIQLGPNATRVLLRWGLGRALHEVAAAPGQLVVRHAHRGTELGALALGAAMRERYGAPYLTLHRADLHAVLLAAAAGLRPPVGIATAEALERFDQDADAVTVRTTSGAEIQADLLIGADGLWSRVRAQLLADGPPRATGDLAYRALLPQSQLPERLRTHDVNVWLGRRLHMVAYPVRRGDWLNLVGIVQARADATDLRLHGWDHATDADDLRVALAGCCAALQDLAQTVPAWRLWVLCERPPMRGAHEHARGRVALVGDAAHPMRPYLAQGAGMALEDAAELEWALAQQLARAGPDLPASLAAFAARRWRRNARVQARAERNGRIFHAHGPLAWGRDASMRWLGARLLDVPWLYCG